MIASHELSGLQKAGVLMISLGAEASAKVFDYLTVEERDVLGAEIVKLRQVDDRTRRRVLDEVNQAVRERSLVGLAMAEKPAPQTAEDDTPLKWLESLNPYEVAALIIRERPQNIALMLAHISSQAAADILGALPENTRNQVAHRLATMKPVAIEAVKAVDEALRQHAGREAPSQRSGGVFSILGAAASRITRLAPDSQNRVPREFTSPEDMLQLTEPELRTALKAIDFDDLRLAMRIAGDELRKAVLANVSEDAALTLHMEISSPSQIRVREIEQAQARIIEVLRSLFAPVQSVEALVE